ncbi:MAG: sugar phosphate isomerase/epimerase [Chloroflexi bacterium]|nr:sugar phosphate isomerase/epimerase [Chloroflexota bacterium]
MHFSCHTWAFNDLTLAEALGTIARLGFRSVDIGSGAHLNAQRAAAEPRKFAAEIKSDLDAFNLDVSDLYLMLPRISLADDERRRKEIDLFKALLPFAQALGTPGITLSPGLAHTLEDSGAYGRARDALREMLEAGQKAGLRISIEPHMDSLTQTPAMTRQLLQDVPGLALTLDWAALVCQDVFHDEIAALLPQARHVQIRQAARAQLQTPFERGRIDIRRVAQALKDAAYTGVVCIKYLKGPGPHGLLEVNAIRESVSLRDALRAAAAAA